MDFSTAKAQLMTNMLVPKAPLERFLQHYEEALTNWISLVKATTLPTNTNSSSDIVKNAFDAVGRAMTGPGLFARLAYVRFLKLFDSLEILIQSERKQGLHGRQRNATIAITRLVEFEKGALSRERIRELRRLARRWEYLSGPSVFLLLMYSEAAEPIIKNHSRTSDTNLKIMGQQVINKIDPKISWICRAFEATAERAVTSGITYNTTMLAGHIQAIMAK
ncbi:hypothetical protein F4678DRAFT_416858 [Xylaria arbuscula]|nr:hypothetical protein F4678DRAFT_416858 [Xylaria arbuscula]